ncbi:MAG: hypothetical protein ABI569_16345, partial [Casimicrobiaceae bacterium]
MSTQDPNDLRDPRFDAAWRAASHEAPPAALDDAILAAARREVRAGPQSAKEQVAKVPSALRPERWWAPLAAAATIGAIAVGVLQLAGPDKAGVAESDKHVVSDMPAATEKAKARAREEDAREPTMQSNAPAPAAPASTVVPAPPPVRQGPPVGGDARNRTMATPPAGSPVPMPTLRKDTGAASKERAATNAAAPAPQAEASGGRQASAMDAAKPAAAPVAEPFPADGQKREAKQAAPVASPPSASMPAESGAGGLAAGKLLAAPEPPARNESMR